MAHIYMVFLVSRMTSGATTAPQIMLLTGPTAWGLVASACDIFFKCSFLLGVILKPALPIQSMGQEHCTYMELSIYAKCKHIFHTRSSFSVCESNILPNFWLPQSWLNKKYIDL